MYDGEDGKYTAYGIFMETRTFYKANCGDPAERMIPEKNIKCALKVMATKGYKDWLESYEMNGHGWRYLPLSYSAALPRATFINISTARGW